MMDSIESIQSRYVSELRELLPEIETWWDAIVKRHGAAAWKRWPTGYAGHPRVLATFRKYYFQIEALNNETVENRDDTEMGPQGEALWGEDDEADDLVIEDQADWLIFSILDEAPELEDLVNGLCFVPIGMDPDEEPV
ncbi:MAG: hypothetical protein FD152_189 [Xanthobacteraceae bacterium]|nr:MAG: hypothetical protein FD152_189 [Xanthobacteraceae bacterium]